MAKSNLKKFLNKNFYLRLISTLILAPLGIFIIAAGGELLKITAIIITIVMAFEWQRMVGAKKNWIIVGIIYLSLFLASLFYVMQFPYGVDYILHLIILVWVVDCSAYIFGKLIGGYKICPKISPNKTWAGLIGASITTAIMGYYINDIALYIGVIITIIAQTGDFFESWVKRKNNTDDSSALIPGQGGMLDRFDGVIAVIITQAGLLVFFNISLI